MLAITGGSGLTQLPGLHIIRRQVVRTPYGGATGALTFGGLDGHPVSSWPAVATATPSSRRTW